MSPELQAVLRGIDKCILDEYTFWKEIYEGKYSDVDVNDGVNLNIVRSNILHEKSRCEEILGDNFNLYSDSYFYPVPAELPNDYMAVTRRLPLPFIGMIFNVAKNLPYSEVMKFDWDESFISL